MRERNDGPSHEKELETEPEDGQESLEIRFYELQTKVEHQLWVLEKGKKEIVAS